VHERGDSNVDASGGAAAYRATLVSVSLRRRRRRDAVKTSPDVLHCPAHRKPGGALAALALAGDLAPARIASESSERLLGSNAVGLAIVDIVEARKRRGG
jgi:hypothetical protein